MKRIVFIDDQQEVLDGMRVRLRRRRREWDMRFYTSGSEAIEDLEGEHCDLVVTDLKMPIMSGTEVLEHVQQLHPESIRIVLSGYADEAQSLEALATAHRFLGKPTEAGELEQVIENCLSVGRLLDNSSLREAVGHMTSLPSSLRVYREVERLVSQQTVDLHELARTIEHSVGLSARVIQVVNSAYFALPRQVESVHQAIVYLGARTVRHVVLCAALFESSCSGEPPVCYDVSALEQHSLLAARLAAELAAEESVRESAFLAGLLHDIGKLALVSADPARYIAIEEEAAATAEPLAVVEGRHFGHTHAELGGFLLGVWGLYPELTDAVIAHHEPPVCEQPLTSLTAIAHLSDYLAHYALDDPAADRLIRREWVEACGLADRLPSLQESARETAASWNASAHV